MISLFSFWVYRWRSPHCVGDSEEVIQSTPASFPSEAGAVATGAADATGAAGAVATGEAGEVATGEDGAVAKALCRSASSAAAFR